MANIDELREIFKAYYSDLLIKQYRDLPKAKAHIELLIDIMFCNGLPWQIMEAYDIDTAVGVQLDVLGKWVGIDRYFLGWDYELMPYIGLTDFDIEETNPLKVGFSTYETPSVGRMLTYDDMPAKRALSDDMFRVAIKLKAIQNNIAHNHKEIDESLYGLFGRDIIASTANDMYMVYFVPQNNYPLIKALMQKKVLPRPIGVNLRYSIISRAETPWLALCDWDNPDTSWISTGFSTYENPVPGRMLTYDDCMESL